MWRQQDHCAQVEPSGGDRSVDRGEASGRSGSVDTLEGGLLGEVELADTVGVHGRVASRPVEPAGIDLGEVGEQLCSTGALL